MKDTRRLYYIVREEYEIEIDGEMVPEVPRGR